MSNPIKAFFSALHKWDDIQLRAHEHGTRTAAPGRVPAALPRHRVSLKATASFGFAGFPEEIRIRDINEKGLYFYTRLDMPVGSSFDIVAVLPSNMSVSNEARRVHYEAKVVRVERHQGEGNYGVGASIRRCETFPLPSTEPNATRNEAPTLETPQPTVTVREEIQPIPQAASLIRQAIRPAEEPTPAVEQTTTHLINTHVPKNALTT